MKNKEDHLLWEGSSTQRKNIKDIAPSHASLSQNNNITAGVSSKTVRAVQELWQHSNQDLTAEQRDKFKALLDSFQDIFSAREKTGRDWEMPCPFTCICTDYTLAK